MSAQNAVSETVKHAPAGWILAWIAGLHLDTWVTVLSFLWLVWLYADKINDKFIKPWLARHRA